MSDIDNYIEELEKALDETNRLKAIVEEDAEHWTGDALSTRTPDGRWTMSEILHTKSNLWVALIQAYQWRERVRKEKEARERMEAAMEAAKQGFLKGSQQIDLGDSHE